LPAGALSETVDPDNAPLPLYAGAGFDEVQQLADDCGITVIG
jgi:hypothetical protein